MFGNAFPHTKSLIVDNLYICFEGDWKLTYHAHVYIVQQMAATSDTRIK